MPYVLLAAVMLIIVATEETRDLIVNVEELTLRSW